MASRLLLSLSLLLLVFTAARAQTADDYFHGGAMFYLSNNIPQAKDVVATGLKKFPEDIKLKKLEELLNQQQQSQQQQQKQEQQKKEQQQDEQKQKREPPKQEQSQENQKPQGSKGEEKKPDERQETAAHQMTPQEAKQLLDAQKGEEQVLQFRPPAEPKNRGKKLKDW